MTLAVTLVSKHEQILELVRDFAHGLGCPVDMSPVAGHRRLRIEVDDDDHSLVELLTHVALSATKVGGEVAEPLCHISYRHPGVKSDVNLTLRVADFRIAAVEEKKH